MAVPRIVPAYPPKQIDPDPRLAHEHGMFMMPPGWLPARYAAMTAGQTITCSECSRSDLKAAGFVHCECGEGYDLCKDCIQGNAAVCVFGERSLPLGDVVDCAFVWAPASSPLPFTLYPATCPPDPPTFYYFTLSC